MTETALPANYVQYAVILLGTTCYLWVSVVMVKSIGKIWLIAGLATVMLEMSMIVFTKYSQHEIDMIQHVIIFVMGIFAVTMFSIDRIYRRLDEIEKKSRVTAHKESESDKHNQ